MSQTQSGNLKVLLSNLGDFLCLNMFFFTDGIMIIGLSVSINLANDDPSKDDNNFLLYLGLVFFIPSVMAAFLTKLAMRGLKTWKNILLIPLKIFLKLVPMVITAISTGLTLAYGNRNPEPGPAL